MKNGLLVYTPLNGKFNIGDYIQSPVSYTHLTLPTSDLV